MQGHLLECESEISESQSRGNPSRAYSCFSSVASTFAVAPAPTVMVLSQVLKPDFSSLILWSPAANRSDDGVLPMNSKLVVAMRKGQENPG